MSGPPETRDWKAILLDARERDERAVDVARRIGCGAFNVQEAIKRHQIWLRKGNREDLALVARVRELYSENHNVAAVARVLGIGHARVHTLLNYQDFPRGRPVPGQH